MSAVSACLRSGKRYPDAKQSTQAHLWDACRKKPCSASQCAATIGSMTPVVEKNTWNSRARRLGMGLGILQVLIGLGGGRGHIDTDFEYVV